MINYIWIILLSLQPAYHDGESWEVRMDRMHNVAKAIDTAATWATCEGRFTYTEKYKCKKRWSRSSKDLALLLITKAWWESRIALNVHAGKCRVFECDATKLQNGTIVHRARTPWQLQRTSFVRGKEWDDMVGTDERSTGIAAIVASRALSAGLAKCGSVKGAISMYAGAGCSWKHAGNRLLFWEKLRGTSPDEFYRRMLVRLKVLEKYD